MDTKQQPEQILTNNDYSYTPLSNAWQKGKTPVEEEDALIFLIRYAKSQNIPNAGDWAARGIAAAKSAPETTARAFVKTRIRRNRNRRIAGKELFQQWAGMVGIEIPDGAGELEMYMRRHSLIVRRFYDEIAAGYNFCKKRARIAGKVLRSVFIGWELRDEDIEKVNRKPPKPIPKSSPPPPRVKDGLQRYNEFMAKLFSSDP